MTLTLTPDQVTQLLKTTFFGAWMKNATKAPEDRDPAMDAYVRSILEALWNAGERERIARDEAGGMSFAPAFEEVLFEQVDEYDDDVFWDELVDHLAQRDYWAKNPSKVGKPLDAAASEAARVGIDREKDKYDREFEERGVERLRLVR